ncbi:MAG: tyrosine protein kinase, partial [Rhodoferax sp.]|nr:tyrosine protein kinase [Rhodoferax sp.]
MNTFPNSPSLVMSAQEDDEDNISLLDLLDIVLEQRWLIAAATAVALALGGGYALVATPIFEANTLIQVEDSKGGASSLLVDMGSLFNIKSPATAEIEILRSRLVIGQAVSNLQLDLDVTPKYLPLVGHWLARRATALSNPGWLGLEGYVSGTEALQVAHLHVPQALAGVRFSVILTPQGYNLI